MIKRCINKFISLFGYKLFKINKDQKNLSFDDIYKNNIRENPIIFDVGANRGQSIKRFRKIFPKSIIHCFEPLEKEFLLLKKNYSQDKNIILNNFALGEKIEKKIFYESVKSENSSFNKLKLNTDWLKIRSKQFNTLEEKFVKLDEACFIQILKLDDYCLENNINFIDILKLDTSGFEYKVLIGSKKMIEETRIRAIETEFMFDNVYETKSNFYEFEKEIITNNFRIYAIEHVKGFKNIFEYMFSVYALYFNEKNK
jgi:FkbM family methyltransferase